MRLWRYSLLVWLVAFPVAATVLAAPRVEIVLTTPSEDTLGAIRQLVQEFNSKQNAILVKHRLLSSASDACHNFYLTSFLARSDSFDVFSGDIIWTAEFASSGWIEPLDSFFKKRKQAEFLPGTIESCTYDGKIWAVPWYTDFGVLFYRKDIVKQPPKTWAQLIAMSKENIRNGKVRYGYVFQGNQYEGLVCNALEFIFNNGGQVLSGNRVTINSPEAVEGLRTLVEIMKISPEDVISFQEEDSRLAFQEDQILFLRNWPYDWNLLNQNGSPVKGKVGVAPLPVGPGGSVGSGSLGGWNLMINRFSKNKLAGWKFVEFLTGKEAQKVNSTMGGRLPTRTAVYSDPEVLRKNPYYSDFLTAYSRSKPRPVSPYYPAISETMQINFYKTITGKMSAEKAIANIASDMKKIVSRK